LNHQPSFQDTGLRRQGAKKTDEQGMERSEHVASMLHDQVIQATKTKHHQAMCQKLVHNLFHHTMTESRPVDVDATSQNASDVTPQGAAGQYTHKRTYWATITSNENGEERIGKKSKLYDHQSPPRLFDNCSPDLPPSHLVNDIYTYDIDITTTHRTQDTLIVTRPPIAFNGHRTRISCGDTIIVNGDVDDRWRIEAIVHLTIDHPCVTYLIQNTRTPDKRYVRIPRSLSREGCWEMWED
jgi:hypothetical protein